MLPFYLLRLLLPHCKAPFSTTSGSIPDAPWICFGKRGTTRPGECNQAVSLQPVGWPITCFVRSAQGHDSLCFLSRAR